MLKFDIPAGFNVELLAEELAVALGDRVRVRDGVVEVLEDTPLVRDLLAELLERHKPSKKSDAQKRRSRFDRNLKGVENLLEGQYSDLVDFQTFGKWTAEQKDALLYWLWQRSERGS